MDDKLLRFFSVINFEEDKYPFFTDAKVKKVVVDNAKKEWIIYINLVNLIPVSIFREMYEKSKNIKDVDKVHFVLKFENDNGYLIDYYRYYFEILVNACPMLESIKENNVVIEGNIINIDVLNKAEEKKILSLKKNIIKFLDNMGFENIELKTNINEEARNNFKKMIEPEVKKEEVPVKSKVVFGSLIKGETKKINNILSEEENVIFEAYVFGIEIRDIQNKFTLVTMKISDNTDSIYAKIFLKNKLDVKVIEENIKEGSWYKFSGYVANDNYTKDLMFNIRSIETLDVDVIKRVDNYPKKRVELHTHTFMSQMDGCVEPKKLIEQAYKWGHKAIAITDHNAIQAYPEVYKTVKGINKNLKEGESPFKVLYGAELTMIEDAITIVLRPKDLPLLESTYVVFDFETTGFNAGGGDSIIEIGAVKLCNGEIIERYDELINPGVELNPTITEITSITNEMLKDKDNEENAIKRFIEWVGDLPMVAHNAKFDMSFLDRCYSKYNLGVCENPVLDTLELSRTLDSSFGRHNLTALAKRYGIEWDEESHHRGDYDAEGTALILNKMLHKLFNQNYKSLIELNNLVPKDEIHKYGRSYHINVLVQNKVGLKNLFKIISFANTKYLYKTPRILRSEISKYREGLLIGSGCYEGEIFIEARSKGEEELTNLVNFYDYVEIQPVSCYSHLVDSGEFANQLELIQNLKKIIKITKESGKIIVASGDVHHLNEEDKITREIIVNQKVPGGGRHPLSKYNVSIPSLHFRTTEEMMNEFEFLTESEKEEIVITNTNKIADMCENVEVIIETGGVPFSPKIKDSEHIVTELVYTKAEEMYGSPLPDNIEERIARELYGDTLVSFLKENEKKYLKIIHETILEGPDAIKKLVKDKVLKDSGLEGADLEKAVKKNLGGIIGGGFDVIYLVAQKLVKHSNDDGYLVGSRGSVGSSFVATLMGITEVNPLPAHYRCLKCKHSIFENDNGEPLGKEYSSGYDLPDKICPKCGEKMYKDGQDMPFATFLGFNADKVPDIDLNFSDLNQAAAHEYTKELFGEDNVYRAGTIGTVADKTAFGFVKGYLEEKGIFKRKAEIERLAIGCTGIKRTTGQHPGGIVVIPEYMEVFDFTPYQYPADDPDKSWKTTHFDYHAIEEDVLKLDILGHSDPTQLRMLQDLSGLDVTKVPLDDKETMSIFLSPKALGVTKEQILCDTGTLGIPEFGTQFTIGLVMDTKPTTFGELIKISGLSHGTDVWLGNAQELIKNNIVPFKEVIGCRDDIMVYLSYKGLKPLDAFNIMETVRKKGKYLSPEQKELMKKFDVPDWYIDSCDKIKYMFPKAHAAAYVMSAFRIAWFKVHKPVLYYATYFSARITDYDIDAMIGGYGKIKEKMAEINNKGSDVTNKEVAVLETLKIALEASARGINFLPIDLNICEAVNFVVKDEKNIYPSFSTIDGLGDIAARTIVEERNKKPFVSVEDLQNRGKVSSTIIEKMRVMGILKDLPESSQLSLF